MRGVACVTYQLVHLTVLEIAPDTNGQLVSVRTPELAEYKYSYYKVVCVQSMIFPLLYYIPEICLSITTTTATHCQEGRRTAQTDARCTNGAIVNGITLNCDQSVVFLAQISSTDNPPGNSMNLSFAVRLFHLNPFS